jgi:transcriptional regulator with XRE-family HTH domain
MVCVATDERIDSALGRVLREARRVRGLTLAQLAERAAVSQPHLSQMENGKASPSISTLYRLAGALGIPPQDLLPPSEAPELLVVRSGSVTPAPMSDRPGSARVHVLVGAPGRDLHADEVRADAGDDLGGWFEHDGEEFLYVLEGALALEVHGHDPVDLAVGDSAWFDSARPHRWSTASAGSLRVLVVGGGAGRAGTLGHSH